jgi:hypothetical protein
MIWYDEEDRLFRQWHFPSLVQFMLKSKGPSLGMLTFLPQGMLPHKDK